MSKPRTKAYVWSQIRKDLRIRNRQKSLAGDVNVLVWATIFCRTSSMPVGIAYPRLRKDIRTFEDKWGPLNLSVITQMKNSLIGRYDKARGIVVFPTLKNAVNVVYPR